MISNKNIFQSVQKQSLQGKQIYTSEKKEDIPYKADKKERKGKITDKEFIIMTEYAAALPRGKRQMNINIPEMKDLLVSRDLQIAPLSKSSGLNSGGNISMQKTFKQQYEYIESLKNKNTLTKTPVLTSFKNNFKL
jgi:hypothetical protein